jgi:hypothetical protein
MADEGVQGLQERIAAILEAHRPYGLDCKCGIAINSDGWWAAHVAPLLVEALGLTEEHGYQIEGDRPDEPDAWFPATEYLTSRPVTHTRFVIPWEAQ